VAHERSGGSPSYRRFGGSRPSLQRRVRLVLKELRRAVAGQKQETGLNAVEPRALWAAGAYTDAVRLLEAALAGGELWDRLMVGRPKLARFR